MNPSTALEALDPSAVDVLRGRSLLTTQEWSDADLTAVRDVARAFASSMAMGRSRASKTTKSFPSPFILRKWSGEASVMGALYGKSLEDC